MSRNYQQDRDWREREGRNREGDNFPSRDDQDFMYGNEGGRSRRDAQNWRASQDMERGQNREEMRRPWEQDRGYERQEGRGQQRFGNERSFGDRNDFGYNNQESQGWNQFGQRSPGRYPGSEQFGFGSETEFGSSGYGGNRWGQGTSGFEGMSAGRNQNQGRQGQATQGQHSGRGPRNYKRSDQRIEEDINERLTEHGTLDATDIEVTVQGGEVTLKGNVENRQAKRLAEEVAEGVSGVKDVTNQIKVQQQSSSEGRSGTDGQTSGKSNQQQRKAS